MARHEISMSWSSILVRCWDYCSCYHPTCLLTSPDSSTGVGEGEGGGGRRVVGGRYCLLQPAPWPGCCRWTYNNQHIQDSFPRSPLLTGFPVCRHLTVHHSFGIFLLEKCFLYLTNCAFKDFNFWFSKSKFFPVIPLEMACLGPLLDPIPCAPTPAQSLLPPHWPLSDTNTANSCYHNEKIVSFEIPLD